MGKPGPGVIEFERVLKSVAAKVGEPVSKKAAKEIFPPLTLEGWRAQWTPRDKLARLVHLSRTIGYYSDPANAPATELAEERALFEEIGAMLLEWEKWQDLA